MPGSDIITQWQVRSKRRRRKINKILFGTMMTATTFGTWHEYWIYSYEFVVVNVTAGVGMCVCVCASATPVCSRTHWAPYLRDRSSCSFVCCRLQTDETHLRAVDIADGEADSMRSASEHNMIHYCKTLLIHKRWLRERESRESGGSHRNRLHSFFSSRLWR